MRTNCFVHRLLLPLHHQGFGWTEIELANHSKRVKTGKSRKNLEKNWNFFEKTGNPLKNWKSFEKTWKSPGFGDV